MGEGWAQATRALHDHWLEEMESRIQPKSIQPVFNFNNRDDGWGSITSCCLLKGVSE